MNPSLSGVLCNTWKVEHQRHVVCAVKGSPVVFLCSFYNPDNQAVRRVLWRHAKSHLSKARLISGVSTRFQFIGDTHRSCSLKIHQVEENDAGKYFVRFNTLSTRLHGQIAPVLKVVGKLFSIFFLKKNACIYKVQLTVKNQSITFLSQSWLFLCQNLESRKQYGKATR